MKSTWESSCISNFMAGMDDNVIYDDNEVTISESSDNEIEDRDSN